MALFLVFSSSDWKLCAREIKTNKQKKAYLEKWGFRPPSSTSLGKNNKKEQKLKPSDETCPQKSTCLRAKSSLTKAIERKLSVQHQSAIWHQKWRVSVNEALHQRAAKPTSCKEMPESRHLHQDTQLSPKITAGRNQSCLCSFDLRVSKPLQTLWLAQHALRGRFNTKWPSFGLGRTEVHPVP